MKKITVFIYYLKKDKSLYAFTIEPLIKNEFELERSMKLYTKKKIKMSEPEYEMFSYRNRGNMLFCNTLSDGENDISFATTSYENCDLEKECRDIDDNISKIYLELLKFPLNAKTKKLISSLTEYYGDGVSESIYHFDTFKIFFKLFRENIMS